MPQELEQNAAQNMRNVSGQYSLLFEIMRIYDIHSHILPSVDDGPSDFSETIEIVDLCEQQGISLIVATPHRKDVSEFKLLPILEEKRPTFLLNAIPLI